MSSRSSSSSRNQPLRLPSQSRPSSSRLLSNRLRSNRFRSKRRPSSQSRTNPSSMEPEPVAVVPPPVAAAPPHVIEHFCSDPTPLKSPRASVPSEPVRIHPFLLSHESRIIARCIRCERFHRRRRASASISRMDFGSDRSRRDHLVFARGRACLRPHRRSHPAAQRRHRGCRSPRRSVCRLRVVATAFGKRALTGSGFATFPDLGNVSCRMFSDHHGFGLVLQLRPHSSPRTFQKHIPRQDPGGV